MDDLSSDGPSRQRFDRNTAILVAVIAGVFTVVGTLIGLSGDLFPAIIDRVWADEDPANVPFGEKISGTYELVGPSALCGPGQQIGLTEGTLQIGPTGATISVEAFTGESSLGAPGNEAGVLDLQCEAILDTGTTPPSLIVTPGLSTYANGYASDEQIAFLWNSICGGIPFFDEVEPLTLQFEPYSDGMKTIVLTTPTHKLLWISYPSDN